LTEHVPISGAVREIMFLFPARSPYPRIRHPCRKQGRRPYHRIFPMKHHCRMLKIHPEIGPPHSLYVGGKERGRGRDEKLNPTRSAINLSSDRSSSCLLRQRERSRFRALSSSSRGNEIYRHQKTRKMVMRTQIFGGCGNPLFGYRD
jgi:hypothetical protein